METIWLNEYPIHIGSDAWPRLKDRVQELSPSRVAVLCDANTRIYCLPRLLEMWDLPGEQVITVPAGERYKSLDSCRRIWQRMLALQLDRKSLLINLGGGVIGDMGGLCASLFKRGLPFIQLPTTLLAQVDASIGGKLAVDFEGLKNSIGLFADPRAVFIFPEFLSTLPERELHSGFAEVIKHALLDDTDHWEDLKALESLAGLEWNAMLIRSLRVKKDIVARDPFEKGLRKLLNFGHTVGHAIESALLDTDAPLLHGEAVAIGMVCEAYLSHVRLGLPLEVVRDLTVLIRRLYPHRHIPPELLPRLWSLMQNDKKNMGGAIHFSLLRRVGSGEWDVMCERDEVAAGLEFYNSFSLSLFS